MAELHRSNPELIDYEAELRNAQRDGNRRHFANLLTRLLSHSFFFCRLRYWFLWAQLLHPNAWTRFQFPKSWLHYLELFSGPSSPRVVVLHPQVISVRGGAEELAEALVLHLNQAGFKAELCTFPHQCFGPSRLSTLIDVILWLVLKVRINTRRRVDAVIATKFPAYLVRHPKKIVWLAHQRRDLYDLYGTAFGSNASATSAIKRFFIRRLDAFALKNAAKIFTISKNVSGRLMRYNNIASEHLYPPLKNKELFHTHSYGDFALYAGRLHPLKRIELAIEAFRYTRTEAKLVIAGEGARKALEKLVTSHGLESKVSFAGYLSEEKLADHYAKCFATVLPLYNEDYGYVCLDSFQSKKPVICCNDSGGLLEFVENDSTGFVCNANPKDIAEKIDLLFENRELAKKMGVSGFQKIQSITWEATVRKLSEYF